MISTAACGSFDGKKALERVRAVDKVFGESFASRFEPHGPQEQ
jgi:hypothetical protein